MTPQLGSNLHPVFQQALRGLVLGIPVPQPRPKAQPEHVRLAYALLDLNSMIVAGGEFPDNVYSMAQRYGVSQPKLEALYDAQFQ